MMVYRIVKNLSRTTDLSGTGSFSEGGRWNDPGTYAIYTSENRALAAMELLVHIDESEAPPGLFIISIEISNKAPVYLVPDNKLPPGWRSPENIGVKNLGGNLIAGNK